MSSILLAFLAATVVPGLMVLLGYLSSNSNTAFPNPLNVREEKEYLEKMKKGDQQARNKLIEHNLRLVAHIVKKFDNRGEEVDDLISIGTIGLIKGVQTYDESKGTRLATYAARCIENEILMYLRTTKKTRNEVFLQEPIGADKDGNEITLMDILQDENDSVADQVGQKFQAAHLHEMMQNLGNRERTVLELRYGLGGKHKKTQREIAKLMNISRSYVSRIEKRAIRLLKQQWLQSVKRASKTQKPS